MPSPIDSAAVTVFCAARIASSAAQMNRFIDEAARESTPISSRRLLLRYMSTRKMNRSPLSPPT